MQHCDPEDLSLLALGERIEVDQDHLASCRQCSDELDSLRHVVLTARSGQVEEVAPPPAVWAGIAAATGVGAGGDDRPAMDRSTGSHPEEPTVPPEAGRLGGRAWPTWALVAAAVAGVLAGAGVTAAVSGTGTVDSPGGQGTPVAAADLEALVAAAESGSAQVVDAEPGRVLRLSAIGLPADEEGFYEVWLLDQQAQRMIPLGVLGGEDGEFVLPSGLDLGEYPVVDVSVEPFDGDPTHSGNSLLRGTLDT